MDNSIANKAIKGFLEMDARIAPDIVHAYQMQAEIGMRYLELQKYLESYKVKEIGEEE